MTHVLQCASTPSLGRFQLQRQEQYDAVSCLLPSLTDGIGAGLIQNLVSMELDGNSLQGTLPAGLAAMKSLKLMDLSANYLTGALPADWTGSPNLALLVLGDNSLTGEQLTGS